MKHKKQYYKSLDVEPYWWGGFWDGLHHFTKGSNLIGFLTVGCSEEDIKNGSYQQMLIMEIGRVSP